MGYVSVLVAVLWVVLGGVCGLSWARVWEDGVVVKSEILCVDGRSRYLYFMLGGYLRILGAHSVQSCCTLSISASYLYLSVADIANPDLFACIWLL